MSICDEIEILDIFSLNSQELSALEFVVGDSGVQGLATYDIIEDMLDETIIPIGFTIDFYGNVIPENWLLLDGSIFDISIYPKLNEFLGTNFLPDFRGRTTEGATLSPNNTGDIQGVRQIPLSADQIVEHTHRYTDTIGEFNTSHRGDHSTGKTEGDNRFRPTSLPLEVIRETSVVGESVPVDNIQPSVVVRKLIKAK